MKRNYICVLVILLTLVGCNNDTEVISEKGDYLLFGDFYGMCGGSGCVRIYKVTETGLYADTEADYNMTNFNFTPMPQEKFLLVNDLPELIPSELLTEESDIIGCPDCADQGGIFIVYVHNGTVNSWRIDQYKPAIPEYLHTFVDTVNNKIQLLNN